MINPTVQDRICEHCRGYYRDSENGWLLGVCAGIADRYRLNAMGVRVLVAVLAVIWPTPTVVAYLLAGLLLPRRKLKYRGSRSEQAFWKHDSKTVDGDAGAGL